MLYVIIIIGVLAVIWQVGSSVNGLAKMIVEEQNITTKNNMTLHSEISERLERVEESMEDILYNTLPERAQLKYDFMRRAAFTLEGVRSLKMGDSLQFVVEEIEHPFVDAFYDKFEYKHDHIDEADRTDDGYRVHGFARWPGFTP